MFWTKKTLLTLTILILVMCCTTFAQQLLNTSSDNQPPVADAGSSRYAATDPVKLDGTGSYDPDNSGPLIYTWQQIAGTSVTITDANTATPTISGFTQTTAVQRCKFELVVSDGQLTSLPDTVEVIIVSAMINYPDPYGRVTTIELEIGVFDPDKPTIVFFGGGWGAYGYGGWPVDKDIWREWHYNANFINFPWYEPDSQTAPFTYDGCANMLITFLSSVSPDYKQPMQTMGQSTGTMPAITVANYLNTTYSDARYAINRVRLFDPVCRDLSSDVAAFCANPVSGEQCWADNYYSHDARYQDRWHFLPIKGALNVYFPQNHHMAPVSWHYWSDDESIWLTDIYNGGVTAGLYLSVVGPGKNLQLSTQPNSIKYYFKWQGDYYPDTEPLPTFSPGYMDFYNEAAFPGKLPEPVTLIEPVLVREAGGYILTCEESQNAIGYELLVGSEPYRVMDYHVISYTPAPPNEVITTLPFEDTWWTVRVRDQYGSTIYADPEYINPALDMGDFDRNGRVDFKDYSILAQYWKQNEGSVDIAPIHGGDGIVDFNDLAVLTENWLTATTIPPLPGQVSNPNPLNGALGVDFNTDLSWTAGADATSHDVYFGTSSPGTFQGNQTALIFEPGTMAHSSTYYWRIDAVNGWGKTTGEVWSFTTIVLQASNPNPANGATWVDIDADLSWTAGVGATSHDVYFGTSSPGTFQGNQPDTIFDPGTMAYLTKYYWRIDEVGAYGTITGVVWSFTTLVLPPP